MFVLGKYFITLHNVLIMTEVMLSTLCISESGLEAKHMPNQRFLQTRGPDPRPQCVLLADVKSTLFFGAQQGTYCKLVRREPSSSTVLANKGDKIFTLFTKVIKTTHLLKHLIWLYLCKSDISANHYKLNKTIS